MSPASPPGQSATPARRDTLCRPRDIRPVAGQRAHPGKMRTMSDLAALISMMPFAERLGIRLDQADGNRAEAVLAWAPGLCTAGGVMHGGALMAFADTVGAVVTVLGLPDGATTAT